jgi:hypothetical protein
MEKGKGIYHFIIYHLPLKNGARLDTANSDADNKKKAKAKAENNEQ